MVAHEHVLGSKTSVIVVPSEIVSTRSLGFRTLTYSARVAFHVPARPAGEAVPPPDAPPPLGAVGDPPHETVATARTTMAKRLIVPMTVSPIVLASTPNRRVLRRGALPVPGGRCGGADGKSCWNAGTPEAEVPEERR